MTKTKRRINEPINRLDSKYWVAHPVNIEDQSTWPQDLNELRAEIQAHNEQELGDIKRTGIVTFANQPVVEQVPDIPEHPPGNGTLDSYKPKVYGKRKPQNNVYHTALYFSPDDDSPPPEPKAAKRYWAEMEQRRESAHIAQPTELWAIMTDGELGDRPEYFFTSYEEARTVAIKLREFDSACRLEGWGTGNAYSEYVADLLQLPPGLRNTFFLGAGVTRLQRFMAVAVPDDNRCLTCGDLHDSAGCYYD